jgi:L-lactate dehydrogenase complex protein LldG
LGKEGLADTPGNSAIWAKSSFLEGVDQKKLQGIAGLCFEVSQKRAAEAKFGISQMEWALADTGSLVQDQSAVEQRLVSTLPEIHIALLPSGRILDGKSALFTRINPRTSRYLAFITGPSRTADIERLLTIGVHGPKRLIIVFVDDLLGEAVDYPAKEGAARQG